MYNIALISVDNTQWFQNEKLNELYVPGGELAALWTKKLIDTLKWLELPILYYNVYDSHPKWHIQFAENYINKKPYDDIFMSELAYRSNKENGLSESAEFTLKELLDEVKLNKKHKVWPTHCIQWTPGSQLTPPLTKEDFDLHIKKWNEAWIPAYSCFDSKDFDLDIMKRREIDTLIITGVATDYCVWKTARDALCLWYKTYVVTDAIQAVNEKTGNEMLRTLRDGPRRWAHNGANIIRSEDLIKELDKLRR